VGFSWLTKNEEKRVSYFKANPIDLRAVNLLPVRPRPLDGELLSSWLVHLATENGVSISCFAKEVLGIAELKLLAVIDALEIPGLLARLETLTAVPITALSKLTFYNHLWVIPALIPAGAPRTTAEMRFAGHKHEQDGLRNFGEYRACIQCWKEDVRPYIRRIWREGFTTTCRRHQVILVRSCANCSKSLNASFSRSFSNSAYFLADLSICRYCGADFRYQEQPSSDFTYYGSPVAQHLTLELYVAIEAIFQRSFDRGGFTLAEGVRLLNGPTPYICPWDQRAPSARTLVYPYIEINGRQPSCEEVDVFKHKFRDWIDTGSA
jgi:hypothetical protein